eukprot:322307_1
MMSDSISLPRITNIFLCLSQFLYGSANACYYSFLSIWLSHNDFSYIEIGYIRGLNQLSILLFVPILCLILDNLSNNNLIIKQLLFSLLCLSVAFARLLFIFYDHSWNLIFCILIVITVAIHETTNSTMDSLLLSIIPNPNKYGRYRLWAGIGWGIVAFTLGIIFDYFLSVDTMFYFWNVFMGTLGLIWLIPTIKNLYFCNNNNKKNQSSLFINDQTTVDFNGIDENLIENPNPVQKISFCMKLYIFLKQINMFKLQIIFSIFVLGMSFGVINTFLFLRLQELGASTALMGMTLVVTILSEIPAFYFVEYALVYIGDLGIVCVGLLAYMLRLSWYGLLGLNINGLHIMNDPWYVLPAETLHGLTYAWIKASICIFAYRLANNENMSQNGNIDLSSFSQGFLSAIFNGFGQGLGGVLGGIIFDLYGPHYLFFGAALGLLPFFIIYVLQFMCCKKLKVDPQIVQK